MAADDQPRTRRTADDPLPTNLHENDGTLTTPWNLCNNVYRSQRIAYARGVTTRVASMYVAVLRCTHLTEADQDRMLSSNHSLVRIERRTGLRKYPNSTSIKWHRKLRR